MRILITEEALRLGNGHWPRYVQDLAEGFRSAGDHVDILAHKEAGEKVFDAVPGAVPWFSRDCRADPRSQGLIGGLRHNLSFYRDLAAWLHGHEPYDWVLSLSSRPKHLLAFALLAQHSVLRTTRFLLLFVLSPGQRDKVGNFQSNAANLFSRLCFRLLGAAIQRGQVLLAAETESMRSEVTEFSGSHTLFFPHPVELKIEIEPVLAATESLLSSRKTGSQRLKAGIQTRHSFYFTGEPPGSSRPVVVVAPGLARFEKGSDILQEAIKFFFKEKRSGAPPVKFVFQWPDPFELPDGQLCAPDNDLFGDDRVEFSKELLTGEAYLDFLRQADLIVLPYRSKSYQARVSRVAIEAAILGKPMVYTARSWTREVAAMVGAGVSVDEESAEALAAALHEALIQLPAIQVAAFDGASKARDFYTVRKFRENLLKGV